EPEEKAAAKQWFRKPEMVLDHLEATHRLLEEVPWEETALEEGLRELAGEKDVGFGRLVHPLRVALVGSDRSPGIFDVLLALGRRRSLDRIQAGLDRVLTARDGPGEAGNI
ncbi:MAG: hypothetical protein EA352_00420, partial [Gemmatimonadales bacterium]